MTEEDPFILHESPIYLVIVESPSKCKSIASYLGSKYEVIASIGHITYLEEVTVIKNKKFEKNKYVPVFVEDKIKKKRMAHTIRSYPPENIYLATDMDREGLAIAWHICKCFDLPIKTVKRVVFPSIDKESILHGISNPSTIDMAMVYSQQTRQMLDMMVGYTISPHLWKSLRASKDKTLSAGRCQTPALRLIYEHDIKQASQNAIQTKNRITAYFLESCPIECVYYSSDEVDDIKEWLQEAKDFKSTMSLLPITNHTIQPPAPFYTSTLLQKANKTYHFSPKQTMALCQILYQQGYITYMRTDCKTYSSTFYEKASQYISETYGKEYTITNTNTNTNTNTKEAHEAIRVTHIDKREYKVIESNSDEDKNLCKMYELIWTNTVQSCMTPCEQQKRDIVFTAIRNGTYRHTVTKNIFQGWCIVKNSIMEEEENVEDNTIIKADAIGRKFKQPDTNKKTPTKDILFYISTLSKTNTYQPLWIQTKTVLSTRGKPYYTEASLIHTLETLEIGRPTTYAPIVSLLLEREYVRKGTVEGQIVECTEYVARPSPSSIEEQKITRVFGEETGKLLLTEGGRRVIEFLLEHFEPLFAYEYTKQMEDKLDNEFLVTETIMENEDWEERRNNICDECYLLMKELSKPLKGKRKDHFPLIGEDATKKYELVFYSGDSRSIRITDTENKYTYLPIKSSIVIDKHKLERGEYTVEELHDDGFLGQYQEKPIFIKVGKYGKYVEWNGIKKAIKTGSTITLENAISLYEQPDQPAYIYNPNVLLHLTKELSIRKGKRGAYIYYMKPDMTSPEFYSLGIYSKNYATIDKGVLIGWIQKTYISHKDD